MLVRPWGHFDCLPEVGIGSDEEAPSPLFCLPDEEERAIEVARILLAHGADPKLRNGSGETAIDAARRRGLEEAADLMEGEEAGT